MFYRTDSSRGDGMIINTYLMLSPLIAQRSHQISPHYFPVQGPHYHIFTSVLWINREVSNAILFASELFFLSVTVNSEL